MTNNLKKSYAEKDWWDDLSESQKQHINEGLADAEKGNVVSSNIFWDELRNNSISCHKNNKVNDTKWP